MLVYIALSILLFVSVVLLILHCINMFDILYYIKYFLAMLISTLVIMGYMIDFGYSSNHAFAITIAGILTGICVVIKIYNVQYHNKLFRYKVRYVDNTYFVHRTVLGFKVLSCRYSSSGYNKKGMISMVDSLKEKTKKAKVIGNKDNKKKGWLSDRDIKVLKID